MLNQQAPVFSGLISQAEAPTHVGGVVEVLFDQSAVVRGFDLAGRIYGRPGNIIPVEHGNETAVIRFPAARDNVTTTVQVVDIIDPAGLLVVVCSDTHRQAIREGHVQVGLLGVAQISAPGGGEVGFNPGLEFTLDGFIGNQTHRARLGTGAEQGALGSRQDLDTVEISCVHVEISTAERDRLFIHVQCHRR